MRTTAGTRGRVRIACGVIALALLFSADAAAYEIDFHYYVVYAILRAKGYSPAEANRIAGFSQFVDDNPATEPIYTNAQNRKTFHFDGSDSDRPTTRGYEQTQEDVRVAFAGYLARPGEPTTIYRLGQLLHLLADTFSHDSFTAWWNPRVNCPDSAVPLVCTGHSNTPERGHAPDRPYNNEEKALAAARSIYDLAPAAPGAIVRPWADLESGLLTAMKRNTAATAEIEYRTIRMRDLMQLFGDAPGYNKRLFREETDAFNVAVGARLSNWKWLSGVGK